MWIFENLRPEEKNALSEGAIRKAYDRGEAIFTQGHAAREMFLLKAGRVKLSQVMEDGTEITLDIRKAGDFLGENMLSEDIEYPVTAWCLEKTLVCGFDKRGFEKIVLQYPNIGLQVIKNLSNRINRLTTRMGGMSITNLEERLYRVLILTLSDVNFQ